MPDSGEPAGKRTGRRQAITVLVRAFPGRTGVLAGLALLSGGLPAAFAVLVGRLVAVLPAGGTGLVALLAGIAAVLLAQELVGAARSWAATDLYRRFDEYLLGRLMATVLAVPGLDLFEEPRLSALRDRAVRIARFGPGELASGVDAQWAARAQGLAAAVLVACYPPVAWYQPVAAVVLAALWLVAGHLLRADYYRGNPFWADPLRRAMYLKKLGLMPDWAKELRVFGLVDWLVDQFGRQWARVMGELWRARRMGRRTLLLLGAAVLAAYAVTLALVARAALAGTLQLGGLAVLVQGLFGMAMLASLHGDAWIENGAVPVPDVLALERAVADRTPERGAARPVAEPVRDIRFDGVRFAYPGDRRVFDGLDLTIRGGTSLAIVGLNGAGKTTLIKLLTGLVRPAGGRITVAGTDLSTMDTEAWRRTVATIFQDFVRYELPARDNIAFGAVDAAVTDEQVWAAAERAGARELLAGLPDGLDTVLSRRYPGGVDLSGGQWQRVALARAMLAVAQGATVLVLDEPTAQLDVRAEADLYDRFLDLTRGLTTIVISHRFSTVRRADRIVVLEAGRVVEDGDHDELVAAGGRYATLFRTQAMRYGGAARA